ncbi:recombinase family protein [Sphingomonas sp. YL-JM2C]
MVEERRGAKLRCAVYTRKSTEDGLDQEYNSLDAQFDACSAYIQSQRHEGWTLVPDRYDDGGFSGGNMDRPGLKQLLTDVAAGKVDVIVLYKIDRLTRSLADFAKIVEILDQAGASFVSVTQAFNTTTSMGRLMLNVLLSFAQFEREVTGERIRDKIAASKKKGLWMGGPVPLGYVVRDRKLVIHAEEAETVRHIMRRYLASSSVDELAADLQRDGYKTKVQNNASGPHRGGCDFRRGTLYHLLSNRIYLGEIVHKGVSYPGEHEAIVPTELWDEVQAKVAERANGGARRRQVRSPSLLIGLIEDGLGRPMTTSHTTRSSRNYRYYVTRPDRIAEEPAWRVSGPDIEALVCARLSEFLADQREIVALTNADAASAKLIHRAIGAAHSAAATLMGSSVLPKEMLLRQLVRLVRLHEEHIAIELRPEGLSSLLGLPTPTPDPIILTTQAARIRRGRQIRLVIPGPRPAERAVRERDSKLVTLLREAMRAKDLVLTSPGKSMLRISTEAGRCRTRLQKLVALSCLAPDIVTAIVEGRQPAMLTAKNLLAANLPLGWDDQRALLGFS